MTLNNIKQMKNQKGFTIVELLIVIVIIGILAALVIVAYNGIQNRANSTAAQNLASVIAKKAEAWNSVQGSYPSYCQLATNTLAPTGAGTGTGTTGCTAAGGNGPNEAKLDNANVIVIGAPTTKDAVQFQKCSGGGAKAIYFTAPSGTAEITVGTATGTCNQTGA